MINCFALLGRTHIPCALLHRRYALRDASCLTLFCATYLALPMVVKAGRPTSFLSQTLSNRQLITVATFSF
jgi:hypothetical protein